MSNRQPSLFSRTCNFVFWTLVMGALFLAVVSLQSSMAWKPLAGALLCTPFIWLFRPRRQYY